MSMLDFGFANFESVTIAEPGAFSYSLPATGGERESVTLTNITSLKMTLPKERGDVQYRVDTLHRFEFAPIFKGDELGRVYCSYDDRFFAESVLVCARDLQKSHGKQPLFSKIVGIFT